MDNLANHITFETLNYPSTNQVTIVAHLNITNIMVLDKVVYNHMMYDLNKIVYPKLKERMINYVKSFDDIKEK